MIHALGLPEVSALASFFAKSSLAWLGVVALTQWMSSARLRFGIWFAFLLALTVQWGLLLHEVIYGRASLARHATNFSQMAMMPASAHRFTLGPQLASAAGWFAFAFFVLYVGVLLGLVVREFLAYRRMAATLRLAHVPSEPLANIFQRADAGQSHRCRLLVLPGLASPATTGWLRPRILVPPSCENQDAAELETAFWHELKHVQRQDALWNGLGRICRLLVWIHPAAHFALRRMHSECELACDAAVVQEHPSSRDIYAACLVRFARMSELAEATDVRALAMASRATPLGTRVRAILKEPEPVPAGQRLAQVAGCAAMLLVFSVLTRASVVLEAAAQTEESGTQNTATAHVPLRAGLRHDGRISRFPDAPLPTAEPLTTASTTPSQHDDALAAEHRVGMGVLTETTGMDDETATSSEAQHGAEEGSPRNRHSSGEWTSVAVGAAERMAPLLVDHDADDRR